LRRTTRTGRASTTWRSKRPKVTRAFGAAIEGTVSSRPSARIASSAWPVSPPPHGLSRGKRARSNSATRSEGSRRLSATAHATPAGPAPAMATSKSTGDL
jgi:hypothetical protein